MAIKDYKKLLIAVGPFGKWDETASKWGSAFDTYSKYGICVKSCPFTVCLEQKNIVTQDWTDKNGHDVYIPQTPYYQPEEISLEFAIVDKDYGQGKTTNKNIADFISEITSRWLCMYDEYTKIGRKMIYLKGPDGQPEYWERGNSVIITFKLKFVVNDPSLGFMLEENLTPSFSV